MKHGINRFFAIILVILLCFGAGPFPAARAAEETPVYTYSIYLFDPGEAVILDAANNSMPVPIEFNADGYGWSGGSFTSSRDKIEARLLSSHGGSGKTAFDGSHFNLTPDYPNVYIFGGGTSVADYYTYSTVYASFDGEGGAVFSIIAYDDVPVDIAGVFSGWARIPFSNGTAVPGELIPTGQSAAGRKLYSSAHTILPGAYENYFKIIRGGRWYPDGLGNAAPLTVPRPETINFLTFHYYQYLPGRDYGGANLWMWPETPGANLKGSPFFFTGASDSEGWITVAVALPPAEIGLIVRGKDDWDSRSNDSNITIDMRGGDAEVWHIHGENTVCDTKPSTDCKVTAALADGRRYINTALAFAPGAVPAIADFALYNATGDAYIGLIDLSYRADRSGAAMVGITTASDIIPDNLYEVLYNGERCGVTMRDILNSYATTATDLGLSYSALNSVFKVWAPTAKSVEVSLYHGLQYEDDYDDLGRIRDGKLNAPDGVYPMERDSQGVWSLALDGDQAGKYYMYRVTQPDGAVSFAIDPYAKAVSANGQLGAVVDLSATGTVAPLAASAPVLKNNTDHIIYELHVRDFSIHESSGISDENKGKYLAFTETETTVNGEPGAPLTGISHLKELGVTTVHLLPVADYASVNELGNLAYGADGACNWGYDPQNYNVPEGSYSSDPKDPVKRIEELKTLIGALHEAGIRVVMDVVYNHTYSIKDGPFHQTVPHYFYRSWENGKYSNGSGCGNEIASERAMVRKYIVDSLLYWQREFRFDGFRFDLMALIDTDTVYAAVKALTAADPNVLIYGEPWVANSTPLNPANHTIRGTQYGNGFALFNDDVREVVKGGNDDDSKGFASGAGDRNGAAIEPLIIGAAAAGLGHLSRASETVTYAAAHDNLILWDKMQYAHGTDIYAAEYAADPYGGGFEWAKRSHLLANGIVLTALGVPFVHAGDEMLRSKKGDHNSYNANDAVNAINWNNKAAYHDVFDYYKGLIALRNGHPAFRMDDKALIGDKFSLIRQDSQVVVYRLGENAGGDGWKNIYIAYNGSGTSKTVYFGAGAPLNAVVGATEDNHVISAFAGTETVLTIPSYGSYTLPAYSMAVLYN